MTQNPIKHQEKYLAAMDVEVWLKKEEKPSQKTPSTSLLSPKPATCSSSPSSWENLQQKVLNCTLCQLSKTRTNVVFGVGNVHTDIMLIGEAPGANEDMQGEPFVGKAGMLLNAMLQAIGLERAQVYIANVIKCRPPGNRDPLPDEVAACSPYLQQQIAIIKPKALVAVGRVAGQFLLKTTEAMGRLRGKMFSYSNGADKIPLFVIYHPAYLLRSPSEKRVAYADLLRIKDFTEKNIRGN